MSETKQVEHTRGECKVMNAAIKRSSRGEPYAVIQTPRGAIDLIAPERMRDDLMPFATLFAAAPDLLAACKEQARLIEGLRSTNAFYRIGKYPTEAALDKIMDAADVQKAASAAIAKAEARP